MPSTTSHLPRLLQLVSPSLPIGAYSYSQGLEWAVEAGWVCDQPSLGDWTADLLENSLCYWDLPLLQRLYQAVDANDPDALTHWSDLLLAGRESAELRDEEHNRGRALASLLQKLGLLAETDPKGPIAASQLTGFAFAAQRWRIPVSQMLTGYAWSWLENTVLSGVKLVPLGQTAGQALLLELGNRLAPAVEFTQHLSDDELGASSPALAIAGARHETQHTRLFRS